MSNKLTQLLREPLLQFLILGTAIYGLYALYGEPPQEERDRTILITNDHVNSLVTGFSKRWNRQPTDEELLGLVRTYVREMLLYREALAMGLDQNDHIIRRRLAQKLEFLTNDLVKLATPEEEVLEQYLQDKLELFRNPDLVSFTQVFIDPDKRGDAALPYADELLSQLQAAGPPSEETINAGDRFMLQTHFSAASALEVRRQMGEDFSEAVMQLEPGRWHGPVLSGYGMHLVYVSDYVAADAPVLADVREKVLNEYFREQTKMFNDDYFETLRLRYDVILEQALEDGSELFPASTESAP